MSQPAVTIHPYFKIHPGQLAAARALLPQFVAKTKTEPGCRYYDFTINGDLVACREGYADAEATLAHLANVGDLLAALMKISDLAAGNPRPRRGTGEAQRPARGLPTRVV